MHTSHFGLDFNFTLDSHSLCNILQFGNTVIIAVTKDFVPSMNIKATVTTISRFVSDQTICSLFYSLISDLVPFFWMSSSRPYLKLITCCLSPVSQRCRPVDKRGCAAPFSALLSLTSCHRSPGSPQRHLSSDHTTCPCTIGQLNKVFFWLNSVIETIEFSDVCGEWHHEWHHSSQPSVHFHML